MFEAKSLQLSDFEQRQVNLMTLRNNFAAIFGFENETLPQLLNIYLYQMYSWKSCFKVLWVDGIFNDMDVFHLVELLSL